MKNLILAILALVILVSASPAQARATSYESAIASAHASGACYVVQTSFGWVVVQECDDEREQSLPDSHILMSWADSPCALAGEEALASEVDGEEFDFDSTYEWAFDACERDTALDCQ